MFVPSPSLSLLYDARAAVLQFDTSESIEYSIGQNCVRFAKGDTVLWLEFEAIAAVVYSKPARCS